MFVALEVAIGVSLVASTGLMIRSYANLRTADAGFSFDDRLIADVLLPARYADHERQQQWFAAVAGELRARRATLRRGRFIAAHAPASTARLVFRRTRNIAHPVRLLLRIQKQEVTMEAVATRSASYQAYQILHIAFIAAPVLAGLDKFVGLLAEWESYLAPTVASLLPVAPHTFMLGVGVIEIAAGALVAFKPSIGGWVVGVWLLGIVANLLLMGTYLDIALRDFGLALGAFALARLAVDYERG